MAMAKHWGAAPPSSGSHMPNPIMHYWDGNGPLWKVFWIYGVATSLALAGLYWLAMRDDMAWAQQILLLFFVPYTAWILVAVWRCAPNTGVERFGIVARGLTVAWAINAILLTLFLEFDLLARYVF